jgi:hypothetical protein
VRIYLPQTDTQSSSSWLTKLELLAVKGRAPGGQTYSSWQAKWAAALTRPPKVVKGMLSTWACNTRGATSNLALMRLYAALPFQAIRLTLSLVAVAHSPARVPDCALSRLSDTTNTIEAFRTSQASLKLAMCYKRKFQALHKEMGNNAFSMLGLVSRMGIKGHLQAKAWN